jgi:UDP-N-acetyl-D-mannosaminuronic acid dehydrogenase
MTKICVLGLGYIGLPTALLLAKSGFEVIGVDVNERVVKTLNQGQLHINDPGLPELFEEARRNFAAQTVVPEADIYLIAVPTPLNGHIRVSDLGYVRSAAEMIYPHLRKGNLVILESTVPPCASEKLVIPILEKSGLKAGEFKYVHCPERAIPGKTLYEMVHNDRIIGGINDESAASARTVYSSYVQGRIYLTDVTTAEFVKLIENTYRDINIAIANEFAQVAEDYGVNVWEAIDLANKHPRVNILQPGPGVGGHCIAVDPWFLTESSTKTGLIQLSREINDSMPNYVIHLVREMLGDIREPTLTVFGVSYKNDISDTRETPALKFIQLAENEGYKVKCYDPHVSTFEYPVYGLDEAVRDSDCIVLITGHDLFKRIDPATLSMRHRNLIDTRNHLDKAMWSDAGFVIKTLGDGLVRREISWSSAAAKPEQSLLPDSKATTKGV